MHILVLWHDFILPICQVGTLPSQKVADQFQLSRGANQRWVKRGSPQNTLCLIPLAKSSSCLQTMSA